MGVGGHLGLGQGYPLSVVGFLGHLEDSETGLHFLDGLVDCEGGDLGFDLGDGLLFAIFGFSLTVVCEGQKRNASGGVYRLTKFSWA